MYNAHEQYYMEKHYVTAGDNHRWNIHMLFGSLSSYLKEFIFYA